MKFKHLFFIIFYRGIEPILCQSKKQLAMSNLKIPNEISISPINDIENSVMLLKRLPNITLQVINPKPVFKVPKSPKLNPKKINGLFNKSKTISESKALSERQNNNIVLVKNKKIKLLNNTKENLSENNSSFLKSLQHKGNLEQTTFDNLAVSTKNNYDPIISKIPEELPNKNAYSAVKNTNTQKTSSPYKFPKKSANFKSKNLSTINPAKKQKISNISTSSHKVKTNSDISLITDNLENKTSELAKDYLLLNVSTESEINIVPACPPLDFLNVSLPKYDSFAMEINKCSRKSNMHLENSQNYIEKQEIDFLNSQNEKQEIDFSNNQNEKQEIDFLNNQNLVDNSPPSINNILMVP